MNDTIGLVKNLKNAITDSVRYKGTPGSSRKDIDSLVGSNLYYNNKTGKVEKLMTKSRSENEKKIIRKLTKDLNTLVKNTKTYSKSKPGKGVSYKQQSDFMSDIYDMNRSKSKEIIKKLESMGCKVTPGKNGYIVTESVKEYTNEDIKNMQIKIYEAYKDERITEEDKNDLLCM